MGRDSWKFFILPVITIGSSLFLVTVHAQQKYSQAVEDRIARVEQNLFGWVQIQGEPGWALRDRMEHYKVSGLSIAVIHHYKVEWAKGYGWADTAEYRPVSVHTVFQAASISKSLNAMGVLRLAQQNRISLYKDINLYLKRWKFPYDSVSKGQKITVAHLLSHTGGVSVHGFNGYKITDTIPDLTTILDGRHPANSAAIRSEFQPGELAQYSGGGYVISQMIVEDITNQPYDRYMWTNVLKPLGMTGSFYSLLPSGGMKDLVAAAYRYDGKDIGSKYHIYPESAAAGLWSTPSDIAKFIIELQLSYLGKSNKVLSPVMAQKMLKPYLNRLYGLGTMIVGKGDEGFFQHTGVNEGFCAAYAASIKNGDGLVIMLNSDNTGLIEEVANSIGSVYDWKGFTAHVARKVLHMPDTVLEKYVGTYRPDNGQDSVMVSRVNDTLYLEDSRVKEKWRIYFTSPENFFLLQLRWVNQTFSMNAEGKVDCLYLNKGGGSERVCRALTTN
jgi:CubicO group peptidase (beta-lactamase class C family)